MSLPKKAVFFDRDGVLNQAIIHEGRPYPPATIDEMKIISGAGDILKSLKKSGFLLIGVTNQPDVARGKVLRETVESINQALMSELPLDAMRVCYHDDQDGCDCRKPLPGLLLQAAKQFSVDISDSYMVGDRWRDIEAGQNAGCKTIFIEYGYKEKQPDTYDFRVKSLQEAADIILRG